MLKLDVDVPGIFALTFGIVSKYYALVISNIIA